MKAIVDQEACISCGLCPSICPEVFEMDANDKAFAKLDPVPPELHEKAREAADSCPVDAIAIQE